MQNVDIAKLDKNQHGISGWWACGFIEPAPNADVVLHDTWNRAIMVSDSHSTAGLMVLTASGPIGDSAAFGYNESPLQSIYENFLQAITGWQEKARKACV